MGLSVQEQVKVLEDTAREVLEKFYLGLAEGDFYINIQNNCVGWIKEEVKQQLHELNIPSQTTWNFHWFDLTFRWKKRWERNHA